jgi:FAD/FMN-containing dehydrogenase
VTAFEFRLHPVGQEVHAGLAIWPAARGRELLALYRDVMRDAREGLSLAFLYLYAPPEPFIPEHLHGELVVAIAGMYAGSVDEGREALRPIREAGPAADVFGPMPYADLQCLIDDPPGFRNWWTSEHLADLPDEAIEAIASRSEAMPHGASQLFMVSWGGAVARVGQEASPLSARQARFVVHPFGMWEDAADDAATIAWARGFRDDLASFATGAVYLNFVGDEGDERLRAGYGGSNLERMTAVKTQFDPDNVFNLHHNIKPAA